MPVSTLGDTAMVFLLTWLDLIDTAWDKLPATKIAKTVFWNRERERLCLMMPQLAALREAVPGSYKTPQYEEVDPNLLPSERMDRYTDKNKELFFAMDLFFIRVSRLLLAPERP